MGQCIFEGLNAALGFGRPRKMASVTRGYYMHTHGLGSDAAGASILTGRCIAHGHYAIFIHLQDFVGAAKL
jgi:hypothetical protein